VLPTITLPFFTPYNILPKTVVNGVRLPKEYGKWYSIDRRFRYWINLGIFDLVEQELQSQSIDMQGSKALSLDTTDIKAHSAGTGAPKQWLQRQGLLATAKYNLPKRVFKE
jgi:hypothetical protein